MLQIVLMIIGVYILAKGKIKISSDRELSRPLSTYFGIIVIIWSALMFLDTGVGFREIYYLILWISLILISFIFLSKSKKISSEEDVLKSQNSQNIQNIQK